VVALRARLDAIGITESAAFRTFSLEDVLQADRIDGRDVARIIQRLTGGAPLGRDFSAHRCEPAS